MFGFFRFIRVILFGGKGLNFSLEIGIELGMGLGWELFFWMRYFFGVFIVFS